MAYTVSIASFLRQDGFYNMNIIIAGDGKVGLALTSQLLREEHDLVVIDSNPNVLRANLDQFDVMTVHGNAATMATLRSANVEEADLLIAATSADEINLLCCLTAKRMNRHIHTIARVRSPEYAEQLIAMREDLGLSMTINPEQSAAMDIFRSLQFPSFLRRETFGKGRVEIVELQVKPDSVLCDIPLSSLYKIAKVKVLVCAVDRDGTVTIPDGSYVLRPGDHIYVTAKAVNLAQLIKNLGISTRKIRQVMLVGGGRLAYYLAERLISAKINVKIIESNPVRARSLAEQLPKAAVIEGDGSSKVLLDSEGIRQTDAVVTLTGIDEENIVVSMYAASNKVSKVVTKVNRLEYSGMFANLGIGSVVSPKELCGSNIVRYVRAMQNQKGSMLALHRIADGKAEAMEFLVDDSVRWRSTPLKDVPLRRGVLIACITHLNQTIIPDGNNEFRKGDSVVVVTTLENPFRQMNDIFNDKGI
jgi:trk system potassium uptake protein TrkA